MAALTKNAISEMVRDRAKRTKIWDHILIVIRASFVFAVVTKATPNLFSFFRFLFRPDQSNF